MIEGLISVIMPTTGRKDRALSCVQLLLATTRPWPIEIVCPVDVDEESHCALTAFFTACGEGHLKGWRVPFSDRYQGQPAAWNAGLKVSKGEYIVFAADDLRWTADWLDAAMACMATLWYPMGGLIGLNDLHRTYAMKRESTHYLATRRFIVEHLNGCIGFPHYAGACNDSEACARARRAGLYVPCRDAIVEHVHYNHGLREMDGTDMMWSSSKRKSLREFRRRQRLGFPDDFEPAITAESLECGDQAVWDAASDVAWNLIE